MDAVNPVGRGGLKKDMFAFWSITTVESGTNETEGEAGSSNRDNQELSSGAEDDGSESHSDASETEEKEDSEAASSSEGSNQEEDSGDEGGHSLENRMHGATSNSDDDEEITVRGVQEETVASSRRNDSHDSDDSEVSRPCSDPQSTQTPSTKRHSRAAGAQLQQNSGPSVKEAQRNIERPAGANSEGLRTSGYGRPLRAPKKFD